jgi:hypothetical protein
MAVGDQVVHSARDSSVAARMKGTTNIWTILKIIARPMRLRTLCDH